MKVSRILTIGAFVLVTVAVMRPADAALIGVVQTYPDDTDGSDDAGSRRWPIPPPDARPT